ncbi:MAG: 1-acyl-sn-glycerol-3-phosphate acyltransferase [Candidatus Hydrogenedentes bacterium]|nr:1-acyl-sn-glycerol-3-phosphate acyltransferase [Candidatus Hydrogenedentota bacterium]
MAPVRGYTRLIVVVTFTVLMFLIFQLCRLPVLFQETADRSLRRWFLKRYGRCVLPLMGARLDVRGTPPRPPFFLVANHLSYMDVFVLAAICGPVFVARHDMEHWPLVGFIMKRIHMVFITREKARDAVRVNQIIDHVLQQHDGVVVFPESGTSDGKVLRPFKPALIQPAVANGYPVYYAALHYGTPDGAVPASEAVVWCRPEDTLLKHVVRLFSLPWFSVRVDFCEEPLLGQDRKQLAAELQEAVDRHFIRIA